MGENRKKDKNAPKVKSTIELVDVYTVAADPAKFEKMKKIRRHAAEINRKRHELYYKRANGKPLVRESSFAGKCFFLGVLIRETNKFYVYAVDAHSSDSPIEICPTKRVLKTNVHLEPCRGCEDHREGYINPF